MTHIFNEELTSEHRGTDFPIKEVSPVLASNSGKVVLARELFYEGNCVVLDHGQHFFTIYMHLYASFENPGEGRPESTQKAASGIEWRHGPCHRAARSHGRPPTTSGRSNVSSGGRVPAQTGRRNRGATARNEVRGSVKPRILTRMKARTWNVSRSRV
jgi:Peptidase family M23